MLNISKATILNATSIQNKSFLKTKLSTKSVSALNTKHSNQSVSAQHRTVLSANTTVSSHCLQTVTKGASGYNATSLPLQAESNTGSFSQSSTQCKRAQNRYPCPNKTLTIIDCLLNKGEAQWKLVSLVTLQPYNVLNTSVHLTMQPGVNPKTTTQALIQNE